MTPRTSELASSPSEVFDPVGPEFVQDRYSVYRRFRETDPVHWRPMAPAAGRWVLFRHADVRRGLTDAALGREPVSDGRSERAAAGPSPFPALAALISPWMLFRDAPEHDRLRGAVARSFTPVEVARLRTRTEELVEEILDELDTRSEVDLVADFAGALSARLIAELIGLDGADIRTFRGWSNDLAAAIDGDPTIPTLRIAERAAVEFTSCVRATVARRRVEPREDLISQLLVPRAAEKALTEHEIVSNCALLLGAGQETTTSLIAFGARCLLASPEDAERLRAAPEALPVAIEEFLRYESPVQVTARIVRRAVEYGGRTLQPGQRVDLFVASANRDPEFCDDPDRLDLARGGREHLSFAIGRHYCIGAELTRMEAHVSLGALLRRNHGWRLVEPEPVWRPMIAFRSLERLLVRR